MYVFIVIFNFDTLFVKLSSKIALTESLWQILLYFFCVILHILNSLLLWKLAKILNDFLYFLIPKTMFWKEEMWTNFYIFFLFKTK